MNNNWTINKIGLVNFWLYDEEEFYFSEGRLLLRGSNGSGKSVTMQSFIPLLLDGNKSADRLDPFGSRARKLENYLLGEDNHQKEESTGYLYMEFVKPVGNAITIGMGLRARRNKPLDFWGFAITDGRKIGEDFLLYKKLDEKIPLSKNELKNRLGEGGEVHDTQREYMAMVNRYLFGFETIEDYDQMIKLLIQLRTPKLSKDFKPTVIYEIMNNSLQPLSDEDLRPMSEAIENMDTIKLQLEHLQESKKAADGLKREFDRYNQYMLFQKAKALLSHADNVETILQEQKSLEADSLRYISECDRLNARRDALWLDLESIEHQKDQMSHHESVDALKQCMALEEEIKKFNDDKRKKEETLNSKERKQREIEVSKRNAEDNIAITEKKLDEGLLEMGELVEGLCFDDHEFMVHELKHNFSVGYDFSLYRQEVDQYRSRIEQGLKALEDTKHKSIAHEGCMQELDRAKREKEYAQVEQEKALALVDLSREEWVEKTYTWEKSNEHLKLEATRMHALQRHINAYAESVDYQNILSDVREVYDHIDTHFTDQMNTVKLEKAKLEEQKRAAEKELSEWQKQKDPTPHRAEKTIKSRERLEALGIASIPFYMAVDYKEGVDEGLKGILEEALIDMGLLDALIIPAAYKNQLSNEDADAGDKYLFAENNAFGYSLSEFLRPVASKNTAVSHHDIQSVVEGILINQSGQGTSIHEDGRYSIGVMCGQTTRRHIPKFLGIQSRIRYRQENIERLQSLIEEINENIEAEAMKIGAFERIRKSLAEEYRAIPNNSDLQTAIGIATQAGLHLENKQAEVLKFTELEKLAYQALRLSKETLLEATAKMALALTIEVYEQAVISMHNYRDQLSDIQAFAGELANLMRELIGLEAQAEEISVDLDDIRVELRDLERNIERDTRKAAVFQDILNKPESKEIALKLREYEKRLKEIPHELEGLAADERESSTNLKHAKQILFGIENKFITAIKIYTYAEKTFSEEYALGYLFSIEDASALALARMVVNDLRVEEKSKKSVEDYALALQDRFKDSQQYLTEYHPSLETLFEGEGEGFEQVLRKRLSIVSKINGKESSFYTLVEYLVDEIEEKEGLLKESDRQIFEEILADTVGKKIRGRITSSQEWVKNMNRLMESMNTSSGLSFSLQWRSRTAEVEGQLDTKVLVDILRSDSQLLSEEQMSSLSIHFRSKIQETFKANEEAFGVQHSYHTIMKEALDYRKWFEFQLSYLKTGEIKKELTDNAFFRFSGGEKAMAMYVPLFASVYARYEGARKDCPRIISLDEAFAGVDETNIRDMFRLVEDLKLNYIINSQVLWGDYDTIPSLSICELLRPNNADFVSVMRYNWNGKVKTLVV
ncbi:MAG: TIGR02680 family protein [Hyphomonadaceae bacterium]|nr:TIGR02680 family protein [Clostridia bacterium]